MPIGTQLIYLVILALPISCIAWTVTHEEIFREPREWCKRNSQQCSHLFGRKFFYLFTCEYCFSHYVTVAFLIITRYKLLYPDWRGYLIAFFALVWLANVYMSLYSHVRLELKKERAVIAVHEKTAEAVEQNPEAALSAAIGRH